MVYCKQNVAARMLYTPFIASMQSETKMFTTQFQTMEGCYYSVDDVCNVCVRFYNRRTWDTLVVYMQSKKEARNLFTRFSVQDNISYAFVNV